MEHSGVIKLIKPGGSDAKEEELYYSINNRHNIIKAWKRKYPTWSVYVVQICPFDGDPVFKESKRRTSKTVIPDSHAPFIRPPAIYDNSKSLYP